LFDHEQRQLEEIALALSGDDPTFLSEPSEHTVRRGRNVSAEIAFVLGAVLLLARIFAQRFEPQVVLRRGWRSVVFEVQCAVAPPGDGGVGEVSLPQDR
jgi:hypothetical protein